MSVSTRDAAIDDLINRLASHGICYLVAGQPRRLRTRAPLIPLLTDLASAPTSRLQSALIALLLRHPEYAQAAEPLARQLPADDPARQTLLLSIVVAAALDREWEFTLDIYLRDRAPIEAHSLATELGLPPPDEDFGRPCLHAAADLLRLDADFPFNYVGDWENAVRRLLSRLSREAIRAGT